MSNDLGRNSDQKPIGPDVTEKPWYEGMTTDLHIIATSSERQREKPAPGIIDLSPSGSSGGLVVPVNSDHIRRRVIGLVLCPFVPGEVLILHNAGTTFRFPFPTVIGGTSLAPLWLPFPITIEAGADISMTEGGGAVDWSAYLFFYAEPGQ